MGLNLGGVSLQFTPPVGWPSLAHPFLVSGPAGRRCIVGDLPFEWEPTVAVDMNAHVWTGEIHEGGLALRAHADAAHVSAAAWVPWDDAPVVMNAREWSGERPAWFDPLLYVVMAQLAAREDALMWHAAMVVSGAKAIAIGGPSGAGKSTTARWFEQLGYATWAEDRMCVDAGGRAHSVPWGSQPATGAGVGQVELMGVLLPIQGSSFSLRVLRGVERVVGLMRLVVGQHWPNATLEHVLTLVEQWCPHVPVVEAVLPKGAETAQRLGDIDWFALAGSPKE